MIQFEYTTELTFSSPAAGHKFVLKILPQNDNRQKIETLEWEINPKPQALWRIRDSFGNEAFCGYVDTPHDFFRFGIKGHALALPDSFCGLFQDEAILKYHSPLTQPSEEIINFHSELAASAKCENMDRIFYFSQAVHEQMEYMPLSTNPRTTAGEAFLQKRGVCQDFAHILLSLLRLEKIPCRYIAGLASDYGETHAWVEAEVDGKFYGIDPTRNKFIDENYLTLTRGRDFDDCAIERGVLKGFCRGFQKIDLKMGFLEVA